ncbi:hypothetical protein QUF54_06150 [Candidatus Marithioploca araucensis]|uniref:Uncharacterized protein n=1 Tax=Candidatus Marithioploca araucensis TaxID=70273 RepID=A0ABT7VTL0_9GAMM|nr:hypothetical protein [Candidatus Marithioploca araucensis]
MYSKEALYSRIRFWSPKLQLWAFFGVQSFSFGRFLEFNASALPLHKNTVPTPLGDDK